MILVTGVADVVQGGAQQVDVLLLSLLIQVGRVFKADLVNRSNIFGVFRKLATHASYKLILLNILEFHRGRLLSLIVI